MSQVWALVFDAGDGSSHFHGVWASGHLALEYAQCMEDRRGLTLSWELQAGGELVARVGDGSWMADLCEIGP